MANVNDEQMVHIPADDVTLDGSLVLPGEAEGIVIFAHGSGSSRNSPRNRYVARMIQESGIGTLLFDLLTTEEDVRFENRFNIPLLTDRLEAATRWVKVQPQARKLAIGYFGASTGAAAALWAAADLGTDIGAVVSRGGRPDLAMQFLGRVTAPTLLIVGGHDYVVIELNQQAYERIKGEKELKIIPGATHLFEEPGALEQAARAAADWFKAHLLPMQEQAA
jgi:putative phosphoribosyl transferase